MDYKYYGIAGSIFFHILLVVVALLINYTIIPASALKRIELIEFGISESANNDRFVSSSSQSSNLNPNRQTGTKSNVIPRKVNMSKSFTQSDEPSFVPEHGKTALNNLELDKKIGNTTENIKSNLKDNVLNSEQTQNEEAVVSTSDDYLSSLTNRLLGDSSGDSPYILEGDVSSRQILNKQIPAYPEGLEISVKIKISFDVLPSGEVTNMVVVQKADPRLEMVSLNALSAWKFNPLLQDIVQKGTITFIYELK